MNENETIMSIGASLENILLSKGIDHEHIEQIKQEQLNQTAGLDNIYEYSHQIENTQLVDTRKIKGGSRFMSGKETVFQLASNSGSGDASLNRFRMAEALEHIKEDPIEQLYE